MNAPTEVMRIVDPVYAATLGEPRLLQVFGTEPVWKTVGDNLKLWFKKQGGEDTSGLRVLPRSRFVCMCDIDHRVCPRSEGTWLLHASFIQNLKIEDS